MSHMTIPQGTVPPLSLVFSVVPAGREAPPGGPLEIGVVALSSLDLSTVTGATIRVRKPDGTLVTWTASYSLEPTRPISGATNATPIVLTVDDTSLVVGELVDVAGVGGNTAANGGPFFFDVLSPTTLALYADEELNRPIAGSGDYTSGGTLTIVDSATVTHALAAVSGPAPLGDLDQIGMWEAVVLLAVPGGVVPCGAVGLDVVSPFA